MRNLALTAMMMAFLTLISKCIGFIREMVMANYFGASYITDAYTMSFTILTVLFGGIIVAISTAYMPVYSKINELRGKQAADTYTSSILNILLIVSVLISIIGIIFSDQIIAVMASGFAGETARLSSFFIKVLFSYVIFSSTAGVMESYLQYKGIFLPQIISGYFVSLCTIAAIIISANTSHYYLAFGMLIGYACRLMVITIITMRSQFQYSPIVKLDDTIKENLLMAFPAFIGSYAMAINQFVDKTLASNLIEGSIASLNYAGLLNTMIMGLTITILSTMIYPRFTQAISLKQYGRFNEIFSTGLYIVIIIALPCSLGAMLYSGQAVQIIYERGAFNSVATAMTSSAFFFYSAGLLFFSANDLITKAYYSMSDMKSPMIFAGISVIINIILSLILVRYMAHSGLALATSIAALFNTILLWAGIRMKHGHVKLSAPESKLPKIIISAFVAIGASYGTYLFIIMAASHIIFMRIAQLGIAVVTAVIVYLVLLKLFRIEELALLRSMFRKI
jgi:putative peptidoglycan lipid II flippase